MNRNRLFLLCVFTFCVGIVNAQISTCPYYNGYWGKWKSHTTRYMYSSPSYRYGLFGGYSGFIIYNKSDHPSKYIFKFDINSYVTPDKKSKKLHYKNNIWYEYSGTVEYYVTERYPTILDILKAFDFPYFSYDSGSEGNPCVKRTARATIKIAPYEDHPKCYNIYFDNIGLGIDLDEGLYFKD